MIKTFKSGTPFYFFCVLILFVAIDSNLFKSYKSNNRISHLEFWIVHSIEHSRKHGLFNTFTFTVIKNGKENPTYKNIKGVSDKILIEDGLWRVYLSALRWPNGIYKIADKLFLYNKSPREAKEDIISLGALFASASIALVLLWIYLEFGLIYGLACLVGAISSPYLMRMSLMTVGPYGMFLIPFAVIAIYIYRNQDRPSIKKLFFITTISFMLVEMIHYAATPVVGVSCLLPLIYYGSRYPNRTKLKLFSVISIGVFVGFFLALFIHYCLLSLYIENWSESLDFIVNRFYKRSNIAGNKLNEIEVAFRETVEISMAAPLNDIFHNYFIYPFILGPFKTIFLIGITMTGLIYASISKFFIPRIFNQKLLNISFLLVTAVFGVIANLLILKPHAYVHTNIDNVWWSLPFSILIVIIPLLILESIWKLLFRNSNKHV